MSAPCGGATSASATLISDVELVVAGSVSQAGLVGSAARCTWQSALVAALSLYSGISDERISVRYVAGGGGAYANETVVGTRFVDLSGAASAFQHDATTFGSSLSLTLAATPSLALPSGHVLLAVEAAAAESLCDASSYATSAQCSSSWPSVGDDPALGWHCDALLGPPTRPGVCSAAAGAWAPASHGTASEWVRAAFFAQPVYMSTLSVWQAYGSPFLTAIDLVDEAGARHAVWGTGAPSAAGDADGTACGGEFTLVYSTLSPPDGAAPYRVAAVWLSTAADGYEMIDAIQLRGHGSCVSPPPSPPRPPSTPATAAPSPPPLPPPYWYPQLSEEEAASLGVILPSVLGGVLLFWYLLAAYWARDHCWACRRKPHRRLKPAGAYRHGSTRVASAAAPRGAPKSAMMPPKPGTVSTGMNTVPIEIAAPDVDYRGRPLRPRGAAAEAAGHAPVLMPTHSLLRADSGQGSPSPRQPHSPSRASAGAHRAPPPLAAALSQGTVSSMGGSQRLLQLPPMAATRVDLNLARSLRKHTVDAMGRSFGEGARPVVSKLPPGAVSLP